jgi:hypothetical protein
VDELRIRAAGLLTPAPAGSRVTISIDTIGLTRDGGRAIGSTRLDPSPLDNRAVDDSAALLRGIAAHADKTGCRLQSVVSEINEVTTPDGRLIDWAVTALARVETVGGPVLLGTVGALPDIVLPFDELARVTEIGDAPADFADRPMVVHPSVAAVLVAGAAFALTSRGGRQGARKLAGRRVLPPITLVRAVDGVDDLGIRRSPEMLVDNGVMCEPGDGTEPAVWDHDTAECRHDPIPRLGLYGTDTAKPGNALELVWCVEGLQRYHADGTVRVQCLTRTAELPGAWFCLALSGKPVHLLRHVVGVHGPETTVFTDSNVLVPSLVFASARTVEESGHGRFAIIDV